MASNPAAMLRIDPKRVQRVTLANLPTEVHTERIPLSYQQEAAHIHRQSSSPAGLHDWAPLFKSLVESTGAPRKGPARVQQVDDAELNRLRVPKELVPSLGHLADVVGVSPAQLMRWTQSASIQLSRRSLRSADGPALAFLLKSSPRLEILGLANNPGLTADGMKPIAEAITYCPALVALDVSRTGLLTRTVGPGDGHANSFEARHEKLDPRAAIALAQSLRSRFVKELAVEGLGFRAHSLHLLHRAWSTAGDGKDVMSLLRLRIGDNRLGDEGARELVNSLRRVGTLTEVDVSANGIGDAGAGALRDLLEWSGNLQVLTAAHNRLGPGGLHKIAHALHLATKLVALDLSGNCLVVGGNRGVRALCESLGSAAAPRLRELNLAQAGLTPHHTKMLAHSAMLRVEVGLVELEVGTATARGLPPPGR